MKCIEIIEKSNQYSFDRKTDTDNGWLECTADQNPRYRESFLAEFGPKFVEAVFCVVNFRSDEYRSLQNAIAIVIDY